MEIQPKTIGGNEAAALREGLIDVAFLWLPADVEGLATMVVDSTHLSVALPINHPLCGQPSVSIDELQSEPRVWLSRASRKWVDWWSGYSSDAKPALEWGPEADSIDEMLEYVGAGRGVGFMPSTMADRCSREDIRWRTLEGIEDTCLAVGYLKAQTSGLAVAFARACVASQRQSKLQFEHSADSKALRPNPEVLSQPA